MAERYTFDPPEEISVKDMTDLFRTLLVDIDKSIYMQAPENVKKMFRPSIFTKSPSKRLN